MEEGKDETETFFKSIEELGKCYDKHTTPQ